MGFLQNFSLFCSAQLKPILFDEGTGSGPLTSKWRISEWWQFGGAERRTRSSEPLCTYKDLHPSVTVCWGDARKLHGKQGLQHQPQLLEVRGGGRRLVPEKQALTHRCRCRLACVSFQNKFSEICGCWKAGTQKNRPSGKIWLEREAKRGDYHYS